MVLYHVSCLYVFTRELFHPFFFRRADIPQHAHNMVWRQLKSTDLLKAGGIQSEESHPVIPGEGAVMILCPENVF